MTSPDSYRECFTCGKWFAHATTLREHENYSCQARVLFVCIPCGMTFDSNCFLDQHLIRHKRRGSLLFDRNVDLDNPQHKCDLCKTPFISPFTLATHQLYSCPATCECALRNPPEVTTTYSEDEPGTSDDEGKLKIVEDVFERRKNKILNKNNSKSKKLLEKASNVNETDENIESICKNSNENKNKYKYSEISTVCFSKNNSSSFKAIQPVKDMNATLDFGISNYENSVSTSNVLKTSEKQTKLSNIDKAKESYSSIELPGKELSTTQKSNTSGEDKLSFVSSKTMTNEAELNNSVQEVKVPLKMVLKLKNIADNVTLSFKTNELHSETLSNASTVITATNNSSTGNTDENIDVISNSCVNNDGLGNDGTENAMKLVKKERTSRSFKPKTYPCRACGRCFAYPETRACHENVICDQDMTTKGHRTYACTKCDFVLQNSNSFDLHTIMKCCPKLETLNTRVLNPVSCQYCGRKFVQTTTLATHLEYCCAAKAKGRNRKEIVANPFEKKEHVSCCN